MKKIVLTGAAGNLGHELRAPLAAMAETLVSTDLVEMLDGLASNETYTAADVSDLNAMVALTEGADMVVHFGAIADEAPFDAILQSNIVGAYNVFEAAHRNGVRRVVYASSIHAAGMHEKGDFIRTDAPHRPDTYYGLAKCFAEDLARLYWDKNGLEAVCLRIYSCTPEPQNARAIGSWLSYGDLVHLVECSITTPVTGFAVVWGVSANDRCPVDNSAASFLGYKPKDNAEDFAKAIFAANRPLDPQNAADMRHGGPFATVSLGNSGVAGMDKADGS